MEQPITVDQAKAASKLSTSTRDMSTLDDLTHDFTNDPVVREYFLTKYGQYFSHEGKRVVRR